MVSVIVCRLYLVELAPELALRAVPQDDEQLGARAAAGPEPQAAEHAAAAGELLAALARELGVVGVVGVVRVMHLGNLAAAGTRPLTGTAGTDGLA
jgi:hypothetical protein